MVANLAFVCRCKQETATDETFCERLCERWNGAKDANGPLFLKPRFGMEEFSVVHFAGPVKYGCTAVDKVHFLPRSRWERQGIANDAPTRDAPPSPPPHPPAHPHTIIVTMAIKF